MGKSEDVRRPTNKNCEDRRYDEVQDLFVVLWDPLMDEDELGVQCNSTGIEYRQKGWCCEHPSPHKFADETVWNLGIAREIRTLRRANCQCKA